MDEAARLRMQARKCRELARQARDRLTAANLRALADDYESEAAKLEGDPQPPNAPRAE